MTTVTTHVKVCGNSLPGERKIVNINTIPIFSYHIHNMQIDKEWIFQKTGLSSENSENVKCLSLPGSYLEKIEDLGQSLESFSRIKELDLSNNSIQNLTSLGSLEYLEKLNLFYNNIRHLNEIKKLNKLKNLRELDLRLNPINTYDNLYRKNILRLIPSLQLLDNREVTKDDRIFDEEVDELLTKNSNKWTSNESSLGKYDNLSPKVLELEKNDQKENSMRRDDIKSFPTERQFAPKIPSRNPTDSITDYDNINFMTIEKPSKHERKKLENNNNLSKYQRCKSLYDINYRPHLSNVQVVSTNQDKKLNDEISNQFTSNTLEKTDLIDRSYRMTNGISDDSYSNNFSSRYDNSPSFHEKDINGNVLHIDTLEKDRDNHQSMNNHLNDDIEHDSFNSFNTENSVIKIISLIDRYWKGTNSLNSNPSFINKLEKVLRPFEKHDQNFNAFDVHRNHLNDNNIISLENERLKKEIEELRKKLEESKKYSKLSTMLEESHQSLISTNEHLLSQLLHFQRMK